MHKDDRFVYGGERSGFGFTDGMILFGTIDLIRMNGWLMGRSIVGLAACVASLNARYGFGSGRSIVIWIHQWNNLFGTIGLQE
jgi:hypothetical protein